MKSLLGFLIAATLLCCGGCQAKDLVATVVPVPPSQGMKAADSYQSSNSEVLWMESNGRSQGQDPKRYGYNPDTKAFVSQHGVYRNEQRNGNSNKNHVDQSYYDKTTNMLVELEENSAFLHAPYYIIVRYPNSTIHWQKKHPQTIRDVYGGIGVLDGVVVVIHSGDRIVGYDIATGNKIWEIRNEGQVRCNPVSGTCVTVYAGASETTFSGVRARDGSVQWNYTIQTSSLSFTLGVVYRHYLVMEDTNLGRYSVDCRSGTIVSMTTALSLHYGGPNAIHTTSGNGGSSSTKDYHVWHLPSGTEIRHEVYANDQDGTIHSNEQMFVFWVPTASSGVYHFFDANSGGSWSNVTVNQDEWDGSGQTFLVGENLVLPQNSTSYLVIDGRSGMKSFGSRHADSIHYYASNGNFLFNLESTLLWGDSEVLQFDVKANN